MYAKCQKLLPFQLNLMQEIRNHLEWAGDTLHHLQFF